MWGCRKLIFAVVGVNVDGDNKGLSWIGIELNWKVNPFLLLLATLQCHLCHKGHLCKVSDNNLSQMLAVSSEAGSLKSSSKQVENTKKHQF